MAQLEVALSGEPKALDMIMAGEKETVAVDSKKTKVEERRMRKLCCVMDEEVVELADESGDGLFSSGDSSIVAKTFSLVSLVGILNSLLSDGGGVASCLAC